MPCAAKKSTRAHSMDARRCGIRGGQRAKGRSCKRTTLLHGMRIGPDVWSVGSACQVQARIRLPPTTWTHARTFEMCLQPKARFLMPYGMQPQAFQAPWTRF